MISRRSFHRAVFVAAGLYNILWGLYAVIDPRWLFRFARMPEENYPQVFARLGMVLGLYGILYLGVARVPERGWAIAAVGITGKVLGPIGLARLIWSGTWPVRTGILCLTNDLIGGFPSVSTCTTPGLSSGRNRRTSRSRLRYEHPSS